VSTRTGSGPVDPAPDRPALVVVGPPGSGKTTVGRALAQRLGVPFTDADALIVERAGKSIAEMFTDDGEDAFRALEREVVADALDTARGVLALGGGAVLAAQTRERLRGHRVVLLWVGLADGIRRTGMSTARPLLAGVNPRATFKALLDARAPLYREVATVEVDTSRRPAGQVARAVLVEVSRVHPGVVPADLLREVEAEAAEDASAADTPDDGDGADPSPSGAVPLPDPFVRPQG
jgi:shikimate kinase